MTRVIAIWLAGLVMVVAGDLKVASLHPLLTDLAKQVGGDRVEVIDLAGANYDPHKFNPGARELKEAKGARLYLVSGKGLEPYLEKLQNVVGEGKVLEVGNTLPTLEAEVLCEHGHAHKTDDPHWWHSLDCWRRAARVVAKQLAEIDPDGAEVYHANAGKVRSELAALDSWVRNRLASVPKEHRVLATAHAAFNYFCREYQWRALPVQGFNREQVTSPKFVGEVAATIRKENVAALFPEKRSNPKMLQALSKNVQVKLGKPLDAAGGDSIEKMFRHNVEAIVEALGEG